MVSTHRSSESMVTDPSGADDPSGHCNTVSIAAAAAANGTTAVDVVIAASATTTTAAATNAATDVGAAGAANITTITATAAAHAATALDTGSPTVTTITKTATAAASEEVTSSNQVDMKSSGCDRLTSNQDTKEQAGQNIIEDNEFPAVGGVQLLRSADVDSLMTPDITDGAQHTKSSNSALVNQTSLKRDSMANLTHQLLVGDTLRTETTFDETSIGRSDGKLNDEISADSQPVDAAFKLLQSKSSNKKEVDFDDLLSIVGEFGKYQLIVYVLISAGIAVEVLFVMSFVFVAAVPTHNCATPGLDHLNLPDDVRRNLTIPPLAHTAGGRFESCLMYHRNYSGWTLKDVYDTLSSGTAVNETVTACTSGWMYDTSVYQSTISTQVRYKNSIHFRLGVPHWYIHINYLYRGKVSG